MAQMAILLVRRGFIVSGSDKEFYEPMGGLLKRSSVALHQGYAAQNIPADVALVVIGNAVSVGNPEVAAVAERKLRYSLFPKVLAELVIAGKHSIVVAGTHGKSTTSALAAVTLSELGTQPGYFIGGVALDLPSSLDSGVGKFSVVEGDEYDSAFFAKVPKFRFYQPDSLIITSIEFDHADIYPDLEAIKREFSWIVNSMTATGKVICCVDCPTVRELAQQWKNSARAKIISYGSQADADYRLYQRSVAKQLQTAIVKDRSGTEQIIELPIPGKHNAQNAVSVFACLVEAGLDPHSVAAAIKKFHGVKRRQEVRKTATITLIEDFAHHPTAVRETVAAIKEWYPGRRLVAVFEPRSTTSQRAVFQDDYLSAFAEASVVVLAQVKQREHEKDKKALDVAGLVEGINEIGIPAQGFPDAAAIRDYLVTEVKAGDVVLVMSNGSFGGLIGMLEQEWVSPK